MIYQPFSLKYDFKVSDIFMENIVLEAEAENPRKFITAVSASAREKRFIVLAAARFRSQMRRRTRARTRTRAGSGPKLPSQARTRAWVYSRCALRARVCTRARVCACVRVHVCIHVRNTTTKSGPRLTGNGSR